MNRKCLYCEGWTREVNKIVCAEIEFCEDFQIILNNAQITWSMSDSPAVSKKNKLKCIDKDKLPLKIILNTILAVALAGMN